MCRNAHEAGVSLMQYLWTMVAVSVEMLFAEHATVQLLLGP